MFKIPVGDLLSSYSGDSKSFSFSGEVVDGYIEDIRFLSPLQFSLDIIGLDDGINVVFHDLDTQIEYEGVRHKIHIGSVEREFRLRRDPGDPDDIRPIENNMIDLGPVIREELIMATHVI